jgi:hypothetical protein
VCGQSHAATALHPGKTPSTHCIQRWAVRRAGLDRCGNLAHTGILSPNRPDHGQLLYRLSRSAPSLKFSAEYKQKYLISVYINLYNTSQHALLFGFIIFCFAVQFEHVDCDLQSVANRSSLSLENGRRYCKRKILFI